MKRIIIVITIILVLTAATWTAGDALLNVDLPGLLRSVHGG